MLEISYVETRLMSSAMPAPPLGMTLLSRSMYCRSAPLFTPLPNLILPQGNLSKLRLLVVMDLTHDLPAVDEAYARNVMTVSLVNAHSDLSRITYPVYAGMNFH